MQRAGIDAAAEDEGAGGDRDDSGDDLQRSLDVAVEECLSDSDLRRREDAGCRVAKCCSDIGFKSRDIDACDDDKLQCERNGDLSCGHNGDGAIGIASVKPPAVVLLFQALRVIQQILQSWTYIVRACLHRLPEQL